jgi:hypothetical protein
VLVLLQAAAVELLLVLLTLVVDSNPFAFQSCSELAHLLVKGRMLHSCAACPASIQHQRTEHTT